MAKYMDGTDLLLGIMEGSTFRPMGHSTGCKISLSSETGERTTKEAETANWAEKYVKKLSCSVSAEGFVYDVDDDADSSGSPAKVGKRGYDTLLGLMLNKTVVKLCWKYREESDGKVYGGNFVITSLERDAQAGDDEKYSVSFENSGPVAEITA